MVNKLQITDEAVIEIDDAIKYYQDISIDLAEDLELKILQKLDWLLANPLVLPVIREGFRKANIERFPYKLVYYISKETVVITALQHHKRRPFYWQGR